MVLRIGHRGAAGYEDENTIESFKKALALKVDMIEFDVRKCKTGEIVLMHDRKVNRTTNGRGFVKNLSYDKIKKLRTKHGYKVPTLDQALKYFKNKCLINIELKDKLYLDVVRLVEKHKMIKDVIISSYNTKILAKVKKLNPRIKIALLSRHRFGLIRKAKNIGCYSIHPHFLSRLTKRFIYRAHKNNLKVYAWAVNWPRVIKKLKKIKVDGIFSDYPDRV